MGLSQNKCLNPYDCERMVALASLVHSADRFGRMVVRSAQVRKVLKAVARLSPYKATVLIPGESGPARNSSRARCIRWARCRAGRS